MENFNWEEFKSGVIAVHCDIEEKAQDFLKECDKHDIKWNRRGRPKGSNCWENEKENTAYGCIGLNSLGYSDCEFFRNEGMKIIKWEVERMKKLTFREVIANIKEGEVWESDVKIIKCSNCGNISVRDKFVDKAAIMNFNKGNLYELKREEYTFEEAFKAYEEGKEIESCYSRNKFKGNEVLRNNEFNWRYFESFKLGEIKGKWYIND